jgi:hypothetical protein
MSVGQIKGHHSLMWRPMRKLVLIAGILCLLAAPQTAASEAGKALFVLGLATVQSESGEGRILGKDSPLFEGDIITTGLEAFAIITLIDGTRMTLKPNTVFEIEEMKYDASAVEEPSKTSRAATSESLLLRLYRGGMRTITGMIAKRSDKGFRVATPVATVGGSAGEFEVRLCEDDCQKEAKGTRRVATGRGSLVVARVAFLTGSLTATGLDGSARQVSLSGSLLTGDTLQTAAATVAVIVFRDESRITLRANSRFHIDSHRYDPESPEDNGTLMRLIEGSVRVVSGLIAKTKPEEHKVVTPVATMSVRGTGFDLRYRGEGRAGQAANAKAGTLAHAVSGLLGHVVRPANAQDTIGLDVWVWDGAIVLTIGTETIEIPQGRAYFVSVTGVPTPYLVVPPSLQNQPAPEPDPEIKVRSDTTPQEQPEVGLYVQAESGDVEVVDEAGNSRVAGPGETLFVNVEEGELQQVSEAPSIDSIPDPTFFGSAADQDISLLSASLDNPERNFECVIE